LPEVDEPEPIFIEPLLLRELTPELMRIDPLTPDVPALAVARTRTPLLLDEPIPLITDTRPPEKQDDIPAETTISPPIPESPVPTVTYKAPPRPKVAVPDPR